MESARATASLRVFSKTFWKAWTHLPEDILHSLVPRLLIGSCWVDTISLSRKYRLCVCVCFHVWSRDLFFEVFYISPSSGLTSDSSMTFHHFRDDRLNLLRRPLHCECDIATAIAKDTEKGGNAAECSSRYLENNFCGMNFWGILIPLMFVPMAEDRPSCHRMKEWNGMKRFCMFLHCLILNHLQQIVTLFTLAIKRRRIPVWREACMSRYISCRVLEVCLVVDMFACVQVVPFRIYQ